jgi:hypothetical protein
MDWGAAAAEPAVPELEPEPEPQVIFAGLARIARLGPAIFNCESL